MTSAVITAEAQIEAIVRVMDEGYARYQGLEDRDAPEEVLLNALGDILGQIDQIVGHDGAEPTLEPITSPLTDILIRMAGL